MLKRLIKQFTPRPLLSLYHYLMTWLAAAVYRFPSEKMVIIGVTGTTGKTTTSYLAAQLLELAGYTTGLTSTAIFKVGEREWLNDKKMTMLGRFQTQALLRQMVRAGCTHAIVETTSEGVLQHRQAAIHYDVLVFTNLSSEHLEAHGGFDNYKKAKLKIFRQLVRGGGQKTLNGKTVPRTIIANLDDPHGKDFLNFSVERKLTFSTSDKLRDTSPQPLVASTIKASAGGIDFTINNIAFHSPMLGAFNVYNCLAAIAVLGSQNIALDKLATLLPRTRPCPGRLELISEGQPFTIIVDFAFEPKSLAALYDTIEPFKQPGSKIINLTGSTGGGRDKTRRPLIGSLAGAKADFVIVTDEDPYDENPLDIINQVAAGARQKGKVEGKNLFKILDRREAIAKALSLANKGDIVLITGKGCEQRMAVAGSKLIPWDDREVVREELAKI